uniref:Bifunctional inhibitor/plant lipid transfer protein/seed storage helical domain-containing protein n=1 Tax=Aegilops tauschii subsp. strangulata TaxID=200361 RepID=A0A453HPA6_AEGTS
IVPVSICSCASSYSNLLGRSKQPYLIAMAASGCSVIVLLVVFTVAVGAAALLQPAEAATAAAATRRHADTRVLWYPGTRQRSPSGFRGFPRSRLSPPSAGRLTPPSPSGRPMTPPPSQAQAPPAPISPPCTAANPQPGFPGMPVGGAGGFGGSSPSPPLAPTDCVTPLAGLMTCASFLTGSEAETPTPQSECCGGLGMFLNSSAAADDRSLRCLCPVILGDVNRMLPKPIDPVRMMYLPIACGVVLPPQVLFICFTGQPTPPVVQQIPDSWKTSSSSGQLLTHF